MIKATKTIEENIEYLRIDESCTTKLQNKNMLFFKQSNEEYLLIINQFSRIADSFFSMGITWISKKKRPIQEDFAFFQVKTKTIEFVWMFDFSHIIVSSPILEIFF